MSRRPPWSATARVSDAGNASTVVRERRSSSCASRASSVSSADATRFMALGGESEPGEEPPVALDVGVAGGEEPLAVENGVGPGEEAQRLQLIAHVVAAGREPHVRPRHEKTRDRDGAHEIRSEEHTSELQSPLNIS